jgi:hypothetical protein
MYLLLSLQGDESIGRLPNGLIEKYAAVTLPIATRQGLTPFVERRNEPQCLHSSNSLTIHEWVADIIGKTDAGK